MLLCSWVSQGTQHRVPRSAQLVGKFHCRNENLPAFNHLYGGPSPATAQRYEPELTEKKTPANRNKPGYSDVFRDKTKQQHLLGRELAKAGAQVAIAGIPRPAKFSRCQQVPDNVSYCHVLSA